MRPKSMILIVIALGCGLVASIGISQVMENRSSDATVETPTVPIYVAAADIPLGQILTAEMISSEEWPQDKVPEAAVTALEQIEGRRTLTRLYPGEPILSAKLIDANKYAGASEKIPKGYRVVSMPVTMDSSASGLINPGDRVDVLVFLKAGRGISLTGTRTILKNVTVFAVNDQFQRDPESTESTTRAKTVSVLVKPNQVEKITLAQELGKIKLSLRRSDDDTEDSSDGATLADLDAEDAEEEGFSISAAVSDTAAPTATSSSTGITDYLNGMRATASQAADTTTQTAWVMHVHSPNDVQVFNWDDREELPRELLAPAPAPQAAAPVAPQSDGATGEPDGLGLGDGLGDAADWIDGGDATSLLN